MKRLRRVARNKRGVSSIFIAIYLSLIGILLISTLFAGQVISRSSITDYLKIEQDRRQEYFQIIKLTDIDDLNFTHILVKNTGAITIRIRALYIGGEFKFDPSAYIEPKEALNISLIPPIPIDGNSLNSYWTVTSERGTRSSELGKNLWDKISGPIYSPNKFYFGPLMLIFDMFHWKSGEGTDWDNVWYDWNNGWYIPAKTKDVTWRILLTNVDNRTITITENSDFSLVVNDIQQNKVQNWYVDPNHQTGNITLIPGDYYFIYYTWSKPYSVSGSSYQEINFNPWDPCLNFLTFTGSFNELDGTLSPFGQTIPFEAVLVTD
jgi:hypothetical protein